MIFFVIIMSEVEIMHEKIEGLGERLKELRTEKDLSLDLVVYDMNRRYEINIAKSNLSRWENNVTAPSLRFAVYLCMYYGVSLDYLLGLTDCKTPADLLARKGKK